MCKSGGNGSPGQRRSCEQAWTAIMELAKYSCQSICPCMPSRLHEASCCFSTPKISSTRWISIQLQWKPGYEGLGRNTSTWSSNVVLGRWCPKLQLQACKPLRSRTVEQNPAQNPQEFHSQKDRWRGGSGALRCIASTCLPHDCLGISEDFLWWHHFDCTDTIPSPLRKVKA